MSIFYGIGGKVDMPNCACDRFKVGGSVYFPVLGRGEVCEIRRESNRPIIVRFSSGDYSSFHLWQLSRAAVSCVLVVLCSLYRLWW